MPELKITFGLTQNEYCSDDKQKYIFTINPATGIVTGEGVTKESDGVFSFQPSLVNLGDSKDKQVTFVYKIDDENSASFSVKVYQKPQTNINFIANTNNPLELTFSVDKPELLSSVVWNFGDGSPVSTEFSPVHIFQSGGKYNVVLKAKNGPCEIAVNMTIVIKEAEPLGLSLPKEAFCSSDESSYKFAVSPSGGKVTGEGVSSSSGVFSFIPIKVNMGTADSKSVTFTYTAPDSRSISLTVQCFAMPSAEINTDQIGTDGTTLAFVAANAKFAKTFNWDFGDGINAIGEFVMHTFTKPGTYIVTLKVSNGECSFSTSTEIVIKEPGAVSVALARNTFCIDDTNLYAYAVSPAGGKVTGEGVTQTPGAADFMFNPHLVLLNELDSKTVTSVYTAPDGRTASASVQVFAQPFAEIGFVSLPGSKIVDFSALNSRFAKTFDWDFGDGTTGTGEKISNTYKKTGKFVVSLKVSNGDCSFNTETTIEIKANQVIKNCQSFGIVLERFKSLSSINPDLFPAFIKNYKSYRDLTIFFEKMSAIITLSSAEQIKFFTVNRIDPLWISNLFVPNIFQEFRILALATFRLLSDLVTTVACIKPDDINQGLVIDELTKNISGALSSIQPQIPLFSAPEKSILTDMLFDINDEASRVQSNDEVTKKPNLIQFLTLMTEIFKKAGIA